MTTGLDLVEVETEGGRGEGGADIRVRLGTTKDGKPEYLVLPRARVESGDLSLEEAGELLWNAQYGIHHLTANVAARGGSSPAHPLFPSYCCLGVTSATFKALGNEIGSLRKAGLPIGEEKGVVQGIFKACAKQGLVDMEMLIGAADIAFRVDQLKEVDRQESIARSRRLTGLGFLTGFAETITCFRTPKGEMIEFPYCDSSLPVNERWPDVVKRAKEAGFIFDPKGRVAGFTIKEDGETVIIPEEYREEQIKVR